MIDKPTTLYVENNGILMTEIRKTLNRGRRIHFLEMKYIYKSVQNTNSEQAVCLFTFKYADRNAVFLFSVVVIVGIKSQVQFKTSFWQTGKRLLSHIQYMYISEHSFLNNFLFFFYVTVVFSVGSNYLNFFLKENCTRKVLSKIDVWNFWNQFSVENSWNSYCLYYQLLIIFMFSKRGSYRRRFVRKGVFINFAKISLRPAILLKRDSQVFSSEFWEVSRNTFFTESLRATAFVSKSYAFGRHYFNECFSLCQLP